MAFKSVTEDQLKTLMVGKNKKTPFQKYKEEQEAKKKVSKTKILFIIKSINTES